MAKGLLYFAQNSAFQHLTKIGKTSKLTVEDRGLSASNVPEDFDYLAVFLCDDVEWAERKVHEQFGGFRHYTQTNRRTEFFWSGCIKNAIAYAKDLKGVYDITTEETEAVEKTNEAGETRLERTPQTTFEMIGLPIGSTIYFRNNRNMPAVVADNKNKVTYNGQTFSISALTIKLDKAQGGNSEHLNGFRYFFFNDVMLWNMRPDQQDKD